MTRTEAIAAALREELRQHAELLNATHGLRAVSFEVKLIPGTTTVRTVILRPEIERHGHVSGNGGER